MGGFNFTPDGKVLDQFLASDAYGRLIAGPVGSGKTTACVMDLTKRAIEQEPAEDATDEEKAAFYKQAYHNSQPKRP